MALTSPSATSFRPCGSAVPRSRLRHARCVARAQVPPNGSPCIFVCAPHANQFLDPFVVQYAVGRTDLAYLAAAKSMRRRFVGAMARVMQSIPVERPQDLAFKGAGEVWLSPEDGATLLGRGSRFRSQLKAGDSISFGAVSATIAAVASDESLTLKRSADDAQAGAWSSYKVPYRHIPSRAS